MSVVREVAMREMRTRSRTKAFRGITAVMVVLAIVGPIVAALWPESSDEPRSVDIGIVGEADEGFGALLTAVAADRMAIDVVTLAEASAETALADGSVDVVVELPDRLVWRERVDAEIAAVVNVALQQRALLDRGSELGLDPDATLGFLTPIEVSTTFVDETEDNEDVRIAVAFLGLMLSFVLPQVFGQLAMLSVIEEKSTRVIEILLSHLRPRQLLAGKILGLSALALGQLAVLVAGLLAGLVLTNAIEIPSSVWQFVPMLVLSVIAGLLLYNTLFALLGSLVSRQEDASQVMLPVFVPFMGGYIIGQTAAFGDAASLAARICTFVPLTSPMLLPVRVARGAIEWWEIAVAGGLLLVSIWLLIRAAGRVYEFTLLHTGARVKWSTALRLGRGAVLD